MRQAVDRERGASLLSVLVIVMLMSAAAVAATDALARSVMIAKASAARADTFWTARGAAQAAASYLATVMEATDGHLAAESDLFAQAVTLPAGRGIVSIQVREATNCLNLNTLLDDTGGAATDSGQFAPYRDLLVAAGFDRSEALALAARLADWMDPDSTSRTYGAEDSHYAAEAEPYRTPGTRLRSLSELKTVAGYDPDVLDRIGALVCVRPGIDQAPLNVNTLTPDQAPLLIALFTPELSETDARSLIERRPVGGWPDHKAFLDSPAVTRIAPEGRRDGAVAVVSTYLEADIQVGTGDLVTAYTALYGHEAGGALRLVSLVRRES